MRQASPPKHWSSRRRTILAKGDASAAVIQLRNALQKAPDDAEARYLLGTALTERRDPAGAVKELRKALRARAIRLRSERCRRWHEHSSDDWGRQGTGRPSSATTLAPQIPTHKRSSSTTIGNALLLARQTQGARKRAFNAPHLPPKPTMLMRFCGHRDACGPGAADIEEFDEDRRRGPRAAATPPEASLLKAPPRCSQRPNRCGIPLC